MFEAADADAVVEIVGEVAEDVSEENFEHVFLDVEEVEAEHRDHIVLKPLKSHLFFLDSVFSCHIIACVEVDSQCFLQKGKHRFVHIYVDWQEGWVLDQIEQNFFILHHQYQLPNLQNNNSV